MQVGFSCLLRTGQDGSSWGCWEFPPLWSLFSWKLVGDSAAVICVQDYDFQSQIMVCPSTDEKTA